MSGGTGPGAIVASIVLAVVSAPLWIGYFRLLAWLGAKSATRARRLRR